MKLTPLGDRVVLKQLVAEETTKSGIVIPGQSKEKPQQAEVVAVGPGGTIDGKEVAMKPIQKFRLEKSISYNEIILLYLQHNFNLYIRL